MRGYLKSEILEDDNDTIYVVLGYFQVNFNWTEFHYCGALN